MIEYVITVAVLVLIWVAYAFYIVPSRKLKYYQRAFEAKGHSAYVLPLGFLEAPLFKIYANEGKTGDAMRIVKEKHSTHDVVLSNVLGRVMIDLMHPDLIKDFYSTENTYTFPKVPGLISAVTRGIGDGLFLSEDKKWKEKRKILNRIFNFDFIKSQTDRISEICDYALAEFDRKNSKQGIVEGKILDATSKMFSHVVMEIFLGSDIRGQQIAGVNIESFITDMISRIMDQGGEPLTMILGTKYLDMGIWQEHKHLNAMLAQYHEWKRNFLHAKIREIEEQSKHEHHAPSNILEAIIMSKDQDSKEFQYDQDSIFGEFNAFFIAGTDTTSHYLEGMLYLLARHPDAQRKARAEVAQFMGTGDYSYDNLKNFRYIEMVQKETIRFYGPDAGLFIREAIKDVHLNGVLVRKGTFVNVMPKGNHYNKKYFPDPEVFRPERWENQCSDLPPFVMGGFSAGARTCIGKHLALLESKIGLIKFLKRYDEISLPPGEFKYEVHLVYSFKEMITTLKKSPAHD